MDLTLQELNIVSEILDKDLFTDASATDKAKVLELTDKINREITERLMKIGEVANG